MTEVERERENVIDIAVPYIERGRDKAIFIATRTPVSWNSPRKSLPTCIWQKREKI